jgi:hypothetical protein
MPTINFRSLGEQEPPKLLQPHEISFRWQGKKNKCLYNRNFQPNQANEFLLK